MSTVLGLRAKFIYLPTKLTINWLVEKRLGRELGYMLKKS